MCVLHPSLLPTNTAWTFIFISVPTPNLLAVSARPLDLNWPHQTSATLTALYFPRKVLALLSAVAKTVSPAWNAKMLPRQRGHLCPNMYPFPGFSSLLIHCPHTCSYFVTCFYTPHRAISFMRSGFHFSVPAGTAGQGTKIPAQRSVLPPVPCSSRGWGLNKAQSLARCGKPQLLRPGPAPEPSGLIMPREWFLW